MSVSNYPLNWPEGWKRTPGHLQSRARFNKGERVNRQFGSFNRRTDLTVSDARLRATVGIHQRPRLMGLEPVGVGGGLSESHPMNCTFPACRCEMPAVCKEKTMDKKSKAEMLAEKLDFLIDCECTQEAAAELRRLSQHESVLKEFLEKTEWVQQSAKPGELGKHRADVLRDRLAALEAENAALKQVVSDSVAALGTSAGCSPECSLEFMQGVPGEIASTVAALKADAGRYRELNTPEVTNFIVAVEREALHQRDRWGADGDAGKTDADWFWLIGYLAGKAIHKPEKQLHHIITTAATCLNWHGARTGNYTAMRPGIDARSKT